MVHSNVRSAQSDIFKICKIIHWLWFIERSLAFNGEKKKQKRKKNLDRFTDPFLSHNKWQSKYANFGDEIFYFFSLTRKFSPGREFWRAITEYIYRKNKKQNHFHSFVRIWEYQRKEPNGVMRCQKLDLLLWFHFITDFGSFSRLTSNEISFHWIDQF